MQKEDFLSNFGVKIATNTILKGGAKIQINEKKILSIFFFVEFY